MVTLKQLVVRAGGVGMIALTSACAQTGGLGEVLGGILNQGQPAGNGGTADVTAEVRNVDTRNQTIQVRTQNNQTAYVYFDNRTQVVYNNQGFAVTALEPGDVVNMRISQTGNNQYYTDYIQVTQSAQQRGVYGNSNSGVYNGNNNGSVYTGDAAARNNPNVMFNIAGTVSDVDMRNGMFTVRDNNNNSTRVAMPSNARSRDTNRFGQIRNGDYVQFRAHWVSPNRFELVRFQ